MQRRPGIESTPPEKREKLPHAAAFVYDDKTPKAQLNTILVFNAMRDRLIALGEMEQN